MQITPEIVLRAYASGIFPMADPDENDEISWYAPDPRAILPLDAFHVSRNLAKLVRSGRFTVRFDSAFEPVMRRCARRLETWISEEIVQLYEALFRFGFAHSVECWSDDRLVGGLYGVALGGAFFGESMFHVERDASKVALVHLVEHLNRRGFTLLDIQFLTPHLQRFGAVEITREQYESRLEKALQLTVSW